MTESVVTIRIRYLSVLRDSVNTRAEEMRLPVGSCLRDVSQWLAGKYQLAVPGPGVMSTLNGRTWSQAPQRLETKLHEGDEIALFPLLSGG
jgi:molybdopterin converting factor small subunit